MKNNKLLSVRKTIQEQAPSFYVYFKQIIKRSGIEDFFNYLSEHTRVYVFSGLIRNFLDGFLDNRDIDIVLGGRIEMPFHLLQGCNLYINKFGGVKVRTEDGFTIDIWFLDETWGLKKQYNKKRTPHSLISTAFFNFSSILYDYNRKKFVISDDFCEFATEKVMNIVYPVNPSVERCIVNTMYYSDSYEYSIGASLRKWIVKHYDENMSFRNAQISRFGEEVIDDQMIKSFVNLCADLKLKDCKIELHHNNKIFTIKF